MKSFSRASLLISTLLTASTAFGQSYLVAPAGSGGSIFPARASIAEVAQSTAPSHKAWELSLIPLFAAQGLDAASSWGHIETNPLMAGSNGTFGAKAAGIKIAFVAGAATAEYLLLKKHPAWQTLFVRLNEGNAILTTGFAVHNFIVVH